MNKSFICVMWIVHFNLHSATPAKHPHTSSLTPDDMNSYHFYYPLLKGGLILWQLPWMKLYWLLHFIPVTVKFVVFVFISYTKQQQSSWKFACSFSYCWFCSSRKNKRTEWTCCEQVNYNTNHMTRTVTVYLQVELISAPIDIFLFAMYDAKHFFFSSERNPCVQFTDRCRFRLPVVWTPHSKQPSRPDSFDGFSQKVLYVINRKN